MGHLATPIEFYQPMVNGYTILGEIHNVRNEFHYCNNRSSRRLKLMQKSNVIRRNCQPLRGRNKSQVGLFALEIRRIGVIPTWCDPANEVLPANQADAGSVSRAIAGWVPIIVKGGGSGTLPCPRTERPNGRSILSYTTVGRFSPGGGGLYNPWSLIFCGGAAWGP